MSINYVVDTNFLLDVLANNFVASYTRDTLLNQDSTTIYLPKGVVQEFYSILHTQNDYSSGSYFVQLEGKKDISIQELLESSFKQLQTAKGLESLFLHSIHKQGSTRPPLSVVDEEIAGFALDLAHRGETVKLLSSDLELKYSVDSCLSKNQKGNDLEILTRTRILTKQEQQEFKAPGFLCLPQVQQKLALASHLQLNEKKYLAIANNVPLFEKNFFNLAFDVLFEEEFAKVSSQLHPSSSYTFIPYEDMAKSFINSKPRLPQWNFFYGETSLEKLIFFLDKNKVNARKSFSLAVRKYLEGTLREKHFQKKFKQYARNVNFKTKNYIIEEDVLKTYLAYTRRRYGRKVDLEQLLNFD